MEITDKIKVKILLYQKNEITEHYIYRKLAGAVKDADNKRVLEKIAEDELRHYHLWKEYTGTDVKPKSLSVWIFYTLSKLLGLSFGQRLMEKGEEKAQVSYNKLKISAE